MRYVAAYLLAVLGGKASPTAADLEKILGSVGIEAETDKVNKVISELKGKNVEELIAEGSKKLASVPSGGAVAAAAAPAAAVAPAAAAAAAPAAAKKEEKKADSDESDDDMGFGLFD
jgi:large subunit ribosomal protein LP2